MGPVRAEWGWGFNSITLRLGPGYKDRPSGATWGRFGPSGAEQGRVGPSRAYSLLGLRRGWACIGIQLNYSKTGPWLQGWGRFGPSGVGEGLGMHWDSIQLL